MTSEVFFGQLSNMDRRDIRGLTDPDGERFSLEDRPRQIQRVLALLKDPRNEGLIADSMPAPFYGYSVRLRGQQPDMTPRQVMEEYLSGLFAGNVQ